MQTPGTACQSERIRRNSHDATHDIDGKGGTDTVSFAGILPGVSVAPNGADRAIVTSGGLNLGSLANIERIVGSPGNDTLSSVGAEEP